MFVGNIKERVEISAIYEKTFNFMSCYGEQHVHKFTDANGNVLVWKSQNLVETSGENWELIPEGSKVMVKATIKEHKEYKGEEQTSIIRCKFDIIEKAATKKEKQAEKGKEQIASLQEGDQILTLPYRTYKEHYADCETVAGSFTAEYGRAQIDVIVRAGRLVASGVRGQRFSTYVFINNATKKKVCFYAVCEENALKQAKKEGYNTNDLKCIQIFNGK